MEVSLINDYVCPGDIVTYECTVIGDHGGITLWMGDFFYCSDSENVIELLHSQFTYLPGGEATTRMCNDGNVVGRIIGVENGSYTSQLNITLTSDIFKKSIECAYDNGPGTSIRRIGSLNITSG